MQRTTKLMFAHYIVRNMALDVLWMRRHRRHVLAGNFDYARIKAYYMYSGASREMSDRGMGYPSPLFDRAETYR